MLSLGTLDGLRLSELQFTLESKGSGIEVALRKPAGSWERTTSASVEAATGWLVQMVLRHWPHSTFALNYQRYKELTPRCEQGTLSL